MSKILFLHGFGESTIVADMSAKKLAESLEKAKITMSKIDGFIKLKPGETFAIADPEYRKVVETGGLDGFAWYPLVEGTAGHREKPAADFTYHAPPGTSDEAVAKLHDYVVSAGGVDGIVGFSQGGELGLLYAEALEAQLARKPLSGKPLKFVGTFGSEDPFTQRGKPAAKSMAKISFLVMYGDGDEDAVVDSQTILKNLKEAGVEKVAEAKLAGVAHNMPQDDAPYATLLKKFAEATTEAPKKPAPSARPMQMPPMPKGWGTISKDNPRVWLVAEEEIVGALHKVRDLFKLDKFSPDEGQAMIDAFAKMQGALTNNSIASDLMSIDEAVPILKPIADGPDRIGKQQATVLLGRLGYADYDYSNPATREKYFKRMDEERKAKLAMKNAATPVAVS